MDLTDLLNETHAWPSSHLTKSPVLRFVGVAYTTLGAPVDVYLHLTTPSKSFGIQGPGELWIWAEIGTENPHTLIGFAKVPHTHELEVAKALASTYLENNYAVFQQPSEVNT